MIQLNITKNDLREILEDIKSEKYSCPSSWNFIDPECKGACSDCLIETILNNVIESEEIDKDK